MSILYAFWCALVKFFNMLIDYVLETITDTLGWLIALLPSIPWEFKPLQWGEFGNLIGYFIPIPEMLTHFSMILILVILWYGIQHILRIVRMVK